MAARVVSREEFVVAAVEHGDVHIAQRYFAQEEVVAEVERVNNFFMGLENPIRYLDQGPADPWYSTQPPGEYLREVGPNSLIFYAAMEKDNVEIIQWLFTPAQAAFMGATLAALMPFVGELAADLNHTEALELLLASDIFTAVLTDEQRQDLLNDMLGIAVERSHEEAIMLLVAHGAQVNLSRSGREDVLSLCASSGASRCVEVLATVGAFIVGASEVLLDAAMVRNIDSARQLLKLGVDWGNNAYTTAPIHAAVEDFDPALLHVLLGQGFADVDIPNDDGYAAVQIASRLDSHYGHASTGIQNQIDPVRILRRYGAKLVRA